MVCYGEQVSYVSEYYDHSKVNMDDACIKWPEEIL